MIGSLLMRERPPEGRKGQTLFDGIQALSGATVMSVGRDKTIRQQRYWEPLADPAHKGRDEAYYIDAYRRVLGEAVACRIRRTTRPPGLIFSGGYDSAAIAGLAGPVLAATKQRLVAATSAMPADYRGGIPHARPWVEMCARHMPHLDVHYVTREGRDALSGLDRVFAETQRPTGLQHYVTDELLMCLAQGGARLIMDGHGGDQTLNPRGQKALAHFLVTGQFRRFAAELPAHLRATRLSRWATFRKDLLSPLLPKALKRLKRRARRRGAPAWHGLPINPAFAARLVAGGAIDSSNLHTELTYGIDMHAQMLTVLRRRSTDGGGGIAWRAASRGLELTRPFYDKRVVELALAIPQDLYVKNGRNRYLACAALKDVYPREFQARSRQNDDRIPDFEEMTKAIEPQLVAEVARMEKSEALSRYVDFAAVRRLLAARGADDRKPGWEVPMLNALHGILFARYIEWFEGHNR
jgi:asparagine synthase (glutamine-hydrolysing)